METQVTPQLLESLRASGVSPYQAFSRLTSELPSCSKFLLDRGYLWSGCVPGYDSDWVLIDHPTGIRYWVPIRNLYPWYYNYPKVVILALFIFLVTYQFGFYVMKGLACLFLPRRTYERLFYKALFYSAVHRSYFVSD